jgi:DNA-directed RNA polymerase subunit M/transcription elongation factor TFIIS
MGKGFTKCNRCSGMMIYEKIYSGTEHFWVWKCLYCGEYIDRVILENRQIQKLNRAAEYKLSDKKQLNG